MNTYKPQNGLLSQSDFIIQILQSNYDTVRTERNTEYYNIPAAFDIETSSFYDHNEKKSCMYIWQFGIYNAVTYGRTWEEFESLIQIVRNVLGLDDHLRLIVYVHNLSYEFQFMRKRFKWNSVFLLEERKPVYALVDGIEFRDSLKLSGGRSLEVIGDELHRYPVQKQVGSLDYEKVRSSDTPLSEKELLYCEDDIRVLLHYIQEKIEDDGDITRIPLTNTSYVRQYIRKSCRANWRDYRNLMNALTVSPDDYAMLKRAFAGGMTHANAHYVDKTLSNVNSQDLKSSYPAVMVLKKFPMSNSIPVDGIFNEETIRPYLDKYCCLFDLELFNVVPRLNQEHAISQNKCFKLSSTAIIDNGRVAFADHLAITCTEQDFYTFREFYEWDGCKITNLRVYLKAYLPKPIVKSILKFFSDKTTLKGVPGKELDYMISKNMLNASYGMMVTAIVRKDLEYTKDDEYRSTIPDVDSALNKYNNSYNRFLYYPWGVWTTAYARRNLFTAIKALGDDYIYSDTDSVKYLRKDVHVQYFEEYNSSIRGLIRESALHFGIDDSQYMPLTPKGEPYTIGEWDDEGMYEQFKTLGAKRYLVKKNGKYQLTVAGVNKKSACQFLVDENDDPFEAFNVDLVIPEDNTKRMIATYIDNPTDGIYTDYLGQQFEYHELSSIHMEKTEYNFNRSTAFINYLQEVVDISE